MGSGKAIKKKFKVAVIHVIHRKQCINYIKELH